VNNAAVVSTPTPNVAPPGDEIDRAHALVFVPLKLKKTASKSTVAAGGRVQFDLTVTNPTGVSAKHAIVCDQLPRGLVYVSSSPKPKLVDGRICWKIGEIGPHKSRHITVTVRALPGVTGTRVNHATLVGPSLRRRKAKASVRVIPKPTGPTAPTGPTRPTPVTG
jgi:uncharacterized repeat protein (TIGR01451 family)